MNLMDTIFDKLDKGDILNVFKMTTASRTNPECGDSGKIGG